MEMESGNNLLEINKATLLTNEKEIYEQIDIRKKLIGDMVGNLYPSILYGEIDRLYKRIEWLRVRNV